MLDKDKVLEELHNHREKIKEFGVKRLELFGSFAVDKQNNESDIDFLVEFVNGRGGVDDYLALLHFLEDLFEKKEFKNLKLSQTEKSLNYTLEGINLKEITGMIRIDSQFNIFKDQMLIENEKMTNVIN